MNLAIIHPFLFRFARGIGRFMFDVTRALSDLSWQAATARYLEVLWCEVVGQGGDGT